MVKGTFESIEGGNCKASDSVIDPSNLQDIQLTFQL